MRNCIVYLFPFAIITAWARPSTRYHVLPDLSILCRCCMILMTMSLAAMSLAALTLGL
jgi:hypothetical protein